VTKRLFQDPEHWFQRIEVARRPAEQTQEMGGGRTLSPQPGTSSCRGAEACARVSAGSDNPKGRPKGAVGRATRSIKGALIASEQLWLLEPDKDGKLVATGIDGMVGYMRWLGINEPKTFGALLTKIMPLTVAADLQQSKQMLSEEEAKAELQANGLDEALVYYLHRYPVDPPLGPSPHPDVIELDTTEFKDAAE